MPTIETLTVSLSDGHVHSFSVSDGYGAIYAANIETGGIGVRKAEFGPMSWYGPADVTHVAVHDEMMPA